MRPSRGGASVREVGGLRPKVYPNQEGITILPLLSRVSYTRISVPTTLSLPLALSLWSLSFLVPSLRPAVLLPMPLLPTVRTSVLFERFRTRGNKCSISGFGLLVKLPFVSGKLTDRFEKLRSRA